MNILTAVNIDWWLVVPLHRQVMREQSRLLRHVLSKAQPKDELSCWEDQTVLSIMREANPVQYQRGKTSAN